jgi:hypothetical protein
MRSIIFLLLWLQGPPATPVTPPTGDLDFAYFRGKVEPLLLEKRPGHARCVVCHSTGTAFRLQQLSPGAREWSEDQSRKNFEMVRRFVTPGHPEKSRLLLMPLAEDAGGVAFHPGGKHWESRDDQEWKLLADWVNGTK